MLDLNRGANTPLAPVTGAGPVRLTLSWDADVALDEHVDLVALLLSPSGKVRSDADLVFFNAPSTPEGSVRLRGKGSAGRRTLDSADVDPARVSGDVDRVVFAACVDSPGLTVGSLRGLELTMTAVDEGAGWPGARVRFPAAAHERAYVAGELYRRSGEWKFRAVGQGWDTGLAALALEFGVNIEGQPSTQESDRTGDSTTASARPNYSAVVSRFRSAAAARTPPDPLDGVRRRLDRTSQVASEARLYATDPAGRRRYKEARQAETAAGTALVEGEVEQLVSVLAAGLSTPSRLDQHAVAAPDAALAEAQFGREDPAPQLASFVPAAQSGLGRLFGKDKHNAAVAEAERRFEEARVQWAEREAERERLRARHAHEVASLWDGLGANEPTAVAAYFELALTAKEALGVFPSSFPRRFRVAYTPDSRQLVVEYDLPPAEIVPTAKAYKYAVGVDTISPAPRTITDRKSIYAEVLAQASLAAVHTVFSADQYGSFDTLVFNGVVDTIDRATGAAIRPCLVTLRTTRDVFSGLILDQVEAAACLRHLGASVSRNPVELAPVRPVLEFSMVDPRFIETSDVLSGLDTRQNLMELTPGQFESLITNLFSRMGLEARQTQASRDGGVDCVAFDNRPIFGGKVVIQAKRYKNTVGVSAVRDLFGTVQNEGASKGILVTTSGYGQSSYEFANNKPLELIDGPNLLYLLSEHSGIEARIAPPEGWRDPRSDSP